MIFSPWLLYASVIQQQVMIQIYGPPLDEVFTEMSRERILGTNQGKETSSRLVSLTATRAPVWLDKRKNKKATTQLHAKGR